jgi:co-chaperonin GroES (HSP10)
MEIKNPEKKSHGVREELHVKMGTEAAFDLVKREFEDLEKIKPLDLNDLPFEVMLWNVVVEPIRPPTKVGNILLAAETQDAQRFKTSVGLLVAVGDGAWKSRTEGGIELANHKHPNPGDFVMYRHYTGQETIMQADGRRLMVMDDTDIIMRVKDPQDYRMYL